MTEASRWLGCLAVCLGLSGTGCGVWQGAADAVAAAAETQTGATADVTAVAVAGGVGAYTFSVTVSSPDTGCETYADWWEVLDEEGALLYRRVLLHSHVNEQPFTRSGGSVDIAADQTVWVRAHMHPQGYGGVAFRGSVDGGFAASVPPSGLGDGAETLGPLPEGCAF